jgi:hypothetical protein
MSKCSNLKLKGYSPNPSYHDYKLHVIKCPYLLKWLHEFLLSLFA